MTNAQGDFLGGLHNKQTTPPRETVDPQAAYEHQIALQDFQRREALMAKYMAEAEAEAQGAARLQRARSLVGTSEGRPDDDFYPTPAWATQAMLERERLKGWVWEPACGDGAMSRVLAENGLEVISTDLVDRGYGQAPYDFLTRENKYGLVDNVVTNPPFKHGEAFVRRAMEVTKPGGKVCMFTKLAFLEGERRRHMFQEEFPPVRVWAFSKRVTLYRDGIPTKNSGMIAFCWVVWVKGWKAPTILDWI